MFCMRRLVAVLAIGYSLVVALPTRSTLRSVERPRPVTVAAELTPPSPLGDVIITRSDGSTVRRPVQGVGPAAFLALVERELAGGE